jgi:cobalt-precorrin 5A hydrolase
MRIDLIAFTDAGGELAERLSALLAEEGDEAWAFNAHADKSMTADEWTRRGFETAEALIFVGACGIAVRKIAPFVRSKLTDPAVLVIDEKGQFVISLLSGHVGGANELALRCAGLLRAVPVVTTATDVNGIFAIDAWAARQGLAIENPQKIKWISGRLLAGETIRLRSELPLAGKPPRGVELVEQDGYDVLISCRTRGSREALRLVPRCLAVGMGARKGVSAEAVREGYEAALKKGSLNPLAVESVCTLDLKKEEPGLLALCRDLGVELRTFTAAELAAAPGSFTASEFVKNVTGVDNVCERSAVLGSGGGRLLLKKNAGNGVTAAVAAREMKLSF